MAETVPLFPLNVVLFPGMPLPLHIFEPRYQQMLIDVTGPDGRRSFGIVAAGAGRSPIAEVGTMAEVMNRQPYPDGRSDVLTVGSRRFRVRSVDPDGRDYLQGEVEWLEEVDAVGDEDVATAAASARRLAEKYAGLLARLGGPPGLQASEAEPLSKDPLRASYEIATRVQLDLAERQHLLSAGSAAQRLVAESALLRRELLLIPKTRSVPAPTAALRINPAAN